MEGAKKGQRTRDKEGKKDRRKAEERFQRNQKKGWKQGMKEGRKEGWNQLIYFARRAEGCGCGKGCMDGSKCNNILYKMQ